MSMTRREFVHTLAVAAAAGFPLARQANAAAINGFYDLHSFGNNVTLMHFTDCHAQLLPNYFREPSVNIGIGTMAGKPPHLVGDALLKQYRISPDTALAHAFTHLDFEHGARTYGKIGGFAHLATLVKRVRAQRPGALLLDGGDTWQGSATALWTKGEDMVQAAKLLGVDIMTGHWEFTLGADRVKELVDTQLKGKIEFLAQNVSTADFGDPVFTPWVMREINGVPIAIIGQAFPYVPIAHPRHFVADWTFGIQEEKLQKSVDAALAKGAHAVVLLSHNGMDVDLKLAGRVSGIDVILGGHTHDAVPDPVAVKNRGGTTLVTNAGCNGKFLAVLDLNVKNKHVVGYQYRLLPVFSQMLDADEPMSELISRVRAPYEKQLTETLAVSDALLYRRGNFNGSFDQIILDALMNETAAEIAFSPGFRWGTSLLPNEPITFEQVMNQTAITYPQVTTTLMSGATIKSILEDVCDNLFNPDPYLQQGGDMVRVGGLRYECSPANAVGDRIKNMTLNGKLIDATKNYKVTGWAPVAEGVKGQPVWNIVMRYLRERKVVSSPQINVPQLSGI
ncbi:MAG: putative periplasmic 5-nucleotidase, putative soxB [Betaproteobacteria bacterium]|nr:putative periplasmic 5-nucleotidase, putative soxB [Betaproteobacteria bacterium]